MSDILFACDHCQTVLCAEDTDIGVEISCPSCDAGIAAPRPAIYFSCPHCRAELTAARNLRGADCSCPECDHSFLVPENSMILCEACGAALEVEEDYFREIAGETIACPQCEALIQVRPLLLPPAKPKPLPQKTPSGPQQAPRGFQPKSPNPPNSSGASAAKTMKLDDLFEGLPQTKSIAEGICPYCHSALQTLQHNAHLCRNCGRVIRTKKRTFRPS